MMQKDSTGEWSGAASGRLGWKWFSLAKCCSSTPPFSVTMVAGGDADFGVDC